MPLPIQLGLYLHLRFAHCRGRDRAAREPTLGHEAVGIVHEVGSEVMVFQSGDRVLIGAITPDWGDPASQAGYSSQSGTPIDDWKFSNTKDGYSPGTSM
jgi:threonine dehydrogenase-like Zn-dependent dehydrogenase